MNFNNTTINLSGLPFPYLNREPSADITSIEIWNGKYTPSTNTLYIDNGQFYLNDEFTKTVNVSNMKITGIKNVFYISGVAMGKNIDYNVPLYENADTVALLKQAIDNIGIYNTIDLNPYQPPKDPRQFVLYTDTAQTAFARPLPPVGSIRKQVYNKVKYIKPNYCYNVSGGKMCFFSN